ncbi:MAG: hypothetical protein E7601_02760 [Ruminococcaceae bacterium]|nr:hypothetical protein [Oscillospiraceae bacterium]
MRVRKKQFMPWQKFISNLTFMYQGILLLASSLLACSSFYLLTSFFLGHADKIYVTEIAYGGIFTRLASPLFWLAIIFTALLLVLIILSDPISLLLLRVFGAGKKEEDIRSYNIKRRIRMSGLNYYAFSLMVYLMFLYSSVVFSLTLKNGTIEYMFIFLSLAILTFLAKKLVALPTYIAMRKHELCEKKRRNREALVVNRDEGESAVSVCTVTLEREKYPVIYACAERAAKRLRCEIEKIEVNLEADVKNISPDESIGPVSLSIGASLLGIFTERELEAYLTAFFVRLRNGTPTYLDKLMTLSLAVDFCISSWNPIDKLYSPIKMLLTTECGECIDSVKSSVAVSIDKYFSNTDDATLEAICSASLKKEIYLNIPFAYDKSFYHPLLKGDSPVEDYQTRLIHRFFTYVENNKKMLYDSFPAAIKNKAYAFECDPEKIAERIETGRLDIAVRPSGAYAEETEKITRFFDSSFALLAEPSFERRSERLYKARVRRVTEFEKDLVSGKIKSVEEKVSAAEDYLELMMPDAAIDVLKDVDNADALENARLCIILGEAKLRLGDISGLAEMKKAIDLDYRYAMHAVFTAKRLLAVNGDPVDSFDRIRMMNSGFMKYLKNDPTCEKLFVMDDITGKYKLLPSVSECTSFDAEEKKAIADSLVEICGEDRLEWAALVSVKINEGEKDLPTLIVRCSEIHPGGYTDSYFDGVYMGSSDLLSSEITHFGDFYPRLLCARLVYNAEIEAFDDMENAIICRKGAIEARKILSRELSSFLSEDDSDYTAFEGEENTDPTDTKADADESDEASNDKLSDENEDRK